jgi:hypothetical protein
MMDRRIKGAGGSEGFGAAGGVEQRRGLFSTIWPKRDSGTRPSFQGMIGRDDRLVYARARRKGQDKTGKRKLEQGGESEVRSNSKASRASKSPGREKSREIGRM